MLAACGDGTKLTPYVVFKRKTIPKETFPDGIHICVHPKGQFDEEITNDWVKTVWKKRRGGRNKQNSLLVLDAVRCHRQDSVKGVLRNMNTDLAIIPGGMTSVLQPLDVSLNKPFKSNLRSKWNSWLDGQVLSQGCSEKIRRPRLSLMCTWIIKAWQEIPEAMVRKSFKKCYITNALDGSEDHLIYEDDREDEEEESDDGLEVYYDDTALLIQVVLVIYFNDLQEG